MKKILLIYLSVLSIEMYSQDNVYFQNLDGTKSTYPIQTIKKFTISNNKILINFTDGTTSERGLEELQNYKFQEATDNNSSISALVSKNIYEFDAYPNPFDKQINVKFTLSKPEFVIVNICDINGKKIQDFSLGKLVAGKHSQTLSIGDLPYGEYIVSLKGDQTIVNKKIVKQL
jgi:hypothetical protein